MWTFRETQKITGILKASYNSYVFRCPIYKTTTRAGTLTTTGQSSNFIIAVDLKTDIAPENWTLRGAAMICQLNDWWQQSKQGKIFMIISKLLKNKLLSIIYFLLKYVSI